MDTARLCVMSLGLSTYIIFGLNLDVPPTLGFCPPISPRKFKTGILSALDFIPSYLPSADWWLFPRFAQRLALIFRIKYLRCFCDFGFSSFYVYVLCVSVCSLFLCVLMYMCAHVCGYTCICVCRPEGDIRHRLSKLLSIFIEV